MLIFFAVSYCVALTYASEYSKENSLYNEDADLNFIELAKKYGYTSEKHTVETEDGYILTVFRIPRGKKCQQAVKKIPVVMMHGLLDSSDTFIISGPDFSLAYILADACYDVWCTNVRGNRYSRYHKTLDPDKDPSFWDFSYNEHGLFDLSATVDYVLSETKASNVSYIGHSQGTQSFFVLASTRPEYNQKFKISINLAPIALDYHLSSPFLRYLANLSPEVQAAVDLFSYSEVFSRDKPGELIEFLCQFAPESVCGSSIVAVAGEIPANIPRERLSAMIGHAPAGTSTKNLFHHAQPIRERAFRQYDYKELNIEKYGQFEPPNYDVTKITAPVALLCGKADMLSKLEDTKKLESMLPNVVAFYTIPDESWAHVSFVWSDGVPEELAPKVIEYLEI